MAIEYQGNARGVLLTLDQDAQRVLEEIRDFGPYRGLNLAAILLSILTAGKWPPQWDIAFHYQHGNVYWVPCYVWQKLGEYAESADISIPSQIRRMIHDERHYTVEERQPPIYVRTSHLERMTHESSRTYQPGSRYCN